MTEKRTPNDNHDNHDNHERDSRTVVTVVIVVWAMNDGEVIDLHSQPIRHWAVAGPPQNPRTRVIRTSMFL